MRSIRIAAVSLAALAFTLPALAQTGARSATTRAAAAASADFSPDEFRDHVTFLADDRLQGRQAGTAGHEAAARYVAEQLTGLGLRPGNGQSWYQQVTFGRSTQADARLTIGDQTFTAGQGVSFRNIYQTAAVAASAPMVFVGYGLDAPSHGQDDYRGLDVRGKIVVVLGGLPQGLPSDVSAHLASDRARMAAARGAIGMITVRSLADVARMPLSRVRSRPSVTWLDANGQPGREGERLRFAASVDPEVATRIFAGAPRSYAQLMADVEGRRRPAGFALTQTARAERTTTNETFTSPNVLGVIPGSDPALAGEYVLLMAHLDHIGMLPAGENPNADRINNGAMDNATGVATLIEVARQFMRPGNRPRRPVLIAAVTAEELGLLGASYLASHPVTGNGRVVGVVNLDMPVLTYNFRDVTAFGAEHSTMGASVERAAAGMNVGVAPDPLPEEGLFTRSDHYPFVAAGIPSVFLMTGFGGEGEQRFRAFLRDNYHKPSDQIDQPFDWQAGARFAEINYRITREVANGAETPRWYRGSFFGDTLGGDQPRAAPRPAAARPAATPPAAARPATPTSPSPAAH